MKNVFSICIIAMLLFSCTGNDKFVLRGSIGKVNKVMVVTKASDWNGDLGKEIRNSFGELMIGLPQPEPILSVSQIAPNGFGSMMKVTRNVLVIGESSQEKFYIKKNVYAQPQTIIYVYGTDDESVIKMFKKHEQEIIDAYIESDIKMTQSIFKQREIDNANYKTLTNLGISLIIPDNFKTVDDTGEFLWLRQHLTSGIAKTGSNNILVYAIPLKDEDKVAENIVAVRDSIGEKYIPGSDQETMHMITEEAYTPFTSETKLAGKKAYETRGKWEVKNDFMAGPFLNYSVIDKKNNRVIVFEGFTYAPSVNKRAFLFELEAIGKSLKIK
ncbi:DUF4837 family protein [Polaribacter aestuariivivens]|uniref:DUF4837 family protein n=1 Tax=Polaribacter aestuariivivens TaxID=2304626 RepID=A0A5S3N5C6_9FLAO|nr:DUF4837 family protein [Polaribacter aestuariivivens]TMM30568.1 DUF4837 family protein [Polaribacter aestuariivivens]